MRKNGRMCIEVFLSLEGKKGLNGNRIIARFLANVFGGKPSVRRFWDENNESFVDILTSSDRPEKGVSSYSTIGLSDAPLIRNGSEYPVRVEIVGACGSIFSGFDNALATAAFNIINSKMFCFPGTIFEDVITMYGISSTMQHFLFVPPFLWNNKLKTMSLKSKTVAWLLAIPISEQEMRYAEEKGSDALEQLFEDKQIDIFDLKRKSVV